MTERRRRRRPDDPPERESAAPAPAGRRAPGPASLATPQLAAPGSVAARVAAAREAQAGFGNHAVSRVLARDPNPKVRKPPQPRPEKQPLRGGRELDQIFDTSQLLKDFAGERLGKGKLEKAMRIDTAAEFDKAWLDYAQRSINPATGRNFTAEEARAYQKSQGVRAFQDADRGEIHVLAERSDLGVQLHEGLHAFSDPGWLRQAGYRLNEGVTEYFTRKIGPDVKVERDDGSFLREYTSVTHLVAVTGEKAVAAAYFDGDVAALGKLVDARAAGAWRRWNDLLEAADHKGANALIKGEKPPEKPPEKAPEKAKA